MTDLPTRIEAHALANALKFGQAQEKNVLPKIIGEFPDVKKDIPGLRKQIEEIVAQVNELNQESILAKLESLAPELLEKKTVKEKDLPPLPNAIDGQVVTRIPPEPSKYNHLGHALTFLTNAMYAERYNGKVVLRFEDCNPEKVNQEYVDAMLEDIQEYLGITPAEIRYVSDDMPVLLEFATTLITCGGAYMCFCAQEAMRANREAEKECPCRGKTTIEHLAEWEKFSQGKYSKGTCVLRFTGDMQSKNTVLRDPVLFRGVETPHFRVGDQYKVWPTYDFYSPIEEHLCGVTHVLRTNEFEIRVPLQEQIKQHLKLRSQEVVQYGRLNINGAVTQGREIRALIEDGTYNGWDDPRLVTLKALKRRGIQPGAYRDLVKKLGLSHHPVTLDFSMLAAANRAIVDPIANRYTFLANPLAIEVEGLEETDVALHLHPDKKEGGRKFRASKSILVREEDHKAFNEKDPIRFSGLCKAQWRGSSAVYLGPSKPTGGQEQVTVASWLPNDDKQHVPVEILKVVIQEKTDDEGNTVQESVLQTISGVAEANISSIAVGEVIQFERFGFCRFDEERKDKTRVFWYTHE